MEISTDGKRFELRYLVITSTNNQETKLVERNLRNSLAMLPSPQSVVLLDQSSYPLNLHVKYKKNSVLQHKIVDVLSVSSFVNSLEIAEDIEWIIFCDDDGYLQKDYARRLINFSINNPKVEILAGSLLFDDDFGFCNFRQKIGGDPNKFPFSKLLTSSNVAVRRETFLRLGGFDVSFGEGSYWGSGDITDFIWKAYFAKVPMAYHREMIFYREREPSKGFISKSKANFSKGVAHGGLVGKWLIENRKVVVLYELMEMMILPLVKMFCYFIIFEPRKLLLQVPFILGRPWGLIKYVMILSLNIFRKKISPRFFSIRRKNENLKILMMSLNKNSGGSAYLINLIKEMKKQNYILYLACPPSKFFRKELSHIVDGFFPLKGRMFSVFTWFKLLSYCQAHNIDIIHSHGRTAGFYGRLLAVFWGKSIHTFDGAYAGSGPINSAKGIFEKFLKFSTDHFVCISHDERKKALKSRIIVAEKSSVIYNGVNIGQIQKDFNSIPKEEARKKFNLPPDKKIWGTLTRLRYQKGLDLFLHEIKKFPMEEIVFAIAGDGRDKKKLRSMVSKYKLQEKVFFLGEVDAPIIFLKALEGYFSFSRWEGLPTGVLEAMACALPCVIPKVSGHNDLINLDAVDFFYPENPGDFRYTLEDVALQRPPEPRGLNWAKREFSTEKMAVKTKGLYAQLR
ncbi:MAG: glycosyltransferase [Halobacteriovoraceae bacterium]|nr:glycosyltransferase [Halobacteriovoraceae bacterium]